MHSRRDNTRKGPGYAVPVNVEVQPDMPVLENLPNVVGLEQDNVVEQETSSSTDMHARRGNKRKYPEYPEDAVKTKVPSIETMTSIATPTSTVTRGLDAAMPVEAVVDEEEQPKLPAMENLPIVTGPEKENMVEQKTCSSSESDPPGVFEALEEDCYIFNLKIVNLYCSEKWFLTHLLGKTCIKIDFKKAPYAKRESSAFERDTFEFFLKDDQENEMEISLMIDYVVQVKIISTVKIPLPSLRQLDKEKIERNIDLHEDVIIKVVMSAKIDHLGTKLLLGHSLCDEEKDYIKERQTHCLREMKFIDELKDNAPAGKDLVPRIAVMGSGGGFRAVTAFSGVMSALVRSKIADMVMYNVGLSGSAWYLSTLYSHPDWPQKKSAIDLRSELRECIMSRADRLFGLRMVTGAILSRTFCFTDVYGRFIGEKLLKQRMNSTLTNQQEKLSGGSAPLPLYAALNVKRKTSAKVFHEWVEFSPFAIGMPKYGTFLQPKLFGSEFFSGRVLKENDEMKLHYLLGIWGSAYCALLHRFIKTNKIGPANVTEERKLYASEVQKDFESYGSKKRDDRYDLLSDVPETATTVRGGDVPSTATTVRGDDVPETVTTVRGGDMPETVTTVRGGIFKPIIEGIMKRSFVDNFTNDIHRRAAKVNNFMRGLRLQEYRPSTKKRTDGICAIIKGMLGITGIESTDRQFEELHEMNPTDAEKMYLVDAGLAFNSPFPLILRPEREVDLILSFDFSERESDKADPFTELILAAKWAKLHKIPFPDINTPAIGEEGYKECYVFENRSDSTCPIVMHFILVNNEFRRFKSPGVTRKTKEEREFGNFDVFDDPDKPYSTFKFQYSERAFDRLASLMEFNTLLSKKTIFDNIKKCVKNRENRNISKLGKDVSGASDKN